MIPTFPPRRVPGPATWGLATSVLAAILGVSPTASADSVTFATFSEADASKNNFTYTQGDGSASVGTQAYNYGTSTYSAGSIPVYFTYAFGALPNLPGDLSGPQLVTMTVNLTSNGSAYQSDGTDIQPLTGTISFTRNTAAAEGSGSRTNLLTITLGSTTDGLSGNDGGRSAGLNMTNSGGDSVTFSSDFINFTGTDQRNIGLTFTSLTSALGISGGFLQDFAASGSGQFADDPGPSYTPNNNVSTPEPSSLILVGGVAGLFIVASRPKKRGKIAVA